MKPKDYEALWEGKIPGTVPKGDYDFGSMSFALVRSDRWFEVVACRWPDQTVHPGCDLMDALELSADTLRALGRHYDDVRPLLVRSAYGLGMFFARYDRCAGLYLYVHVHCRADMAAQIIVSGALGDGFEVTAEVRAMSDRMRPYDELPRSERPCYEHTYQILQGALRHLSDIRAHLIGACETQAGASSPVGLEQMESMTERLSRFAGCGMTRLPAHGVRAPRGMCYHARLLEVTTLFWLCQVRMLALERAGWYDVRTVGNRMDEKLVYHLHFPVIMPEREPWPASPEQMPQWDHMLRVAELSGLEVEAAWGDPCQVEDVDGVWCRDLSLTLVSLRDPAGELSGDLKARLVLLK